MNSTESRHICACESAREACDISKTTYVGTIAVEVSKILKLIKDFRIIIIDDDKILDDSIAN